MIDTILTFPLVHWLCQKLQTPSPLQCPPLVHSPFTSTLPLTETVHLVTWWTWDPPQELASPHPPWNGANISFMSVSSFRELKLWYFHPDIGVFMCPNTNLIHILLSLVSTSPIEGTSPLPHGQTLHLKTAVLHLFHFDDLWCRWIPNWWLHVMQPPHWCSIKA